MSPGEAVRTTLEALQEAGISHLVTGGLAANLHSFSRVTKDADIVIEMEPRAFAKFANLLPESLELDEQISFETITGSRRQVIALRGSPYRIELFLLGSDPHHQERFQRRILRAVPELECAAWVATAEDMVIQKLRWNRDKDRDDARNILAVQGDALDFAFIERWCAEHGTLERLHEMRRSIPPILGEVEC